MLLYTRQLAVYAHSRKEDATYFVDFVSVDGERWVRDPAWKSPVAEAAMNKEDC